MPHFRTWDDIYYDYQCVADLGAINIGVGEMHTDVVQRTAKYQFSPESVPFTP